MRCFICASKCTGVQWENFYLFQVENDLSIFYLNWWLFCELAFLDDSWDSRIWIGFSDRCWVFCLKKYKNLMNKYKNLMNTSTCTELRYTVRKVDLSPMDFFSDYDPVNFSKTAWKVQWGVFPAWKISIPKLFKAISISKLFSINFEQF